MTDQELLRRAMNGEVFGNGQKQIALLVAEISILKKALEECDSLNAEVIRLKRGIANMREDLATDWTRW